MRAFCLFQQFIKRRTDFQKTNTLAVDNLEQELYNGLTLVAAAILRSCPPADFRGGSVIQ